MAKKSKPSKSAKAGKAKPKGRKPAAAAQSAAPGAPAAPKSPNKAQVTRISEGKLQTLLRTCASLKKQGETLNGSLREKIGYAVEHDYLNKEVFALIRRLDRKEPEALAIFLDDLEHYIEASGLGDRADAVQNLNLEGGANPGPKKDKTGGNPKGRTVNGNGSEAAAKGNESTEKESEVGDGEGDDPDNVSRPQFGSATGQAPGGAVHVLPDAPGKH